MRYSFALLAAVAAAAPQAVNPISQIGDGQIQAPTAPASMPYSAPAVPSVPAVVPSVMPSMPSMPVSAPVVTPVVPLPVTPKPSMPVYTAPGGNATTPAAGTGASKTPSAPTGASSSGLPVATGAAGSSFVSFGGVVLAAVGAAVFA